jgi:hypothetical protein
MTTVGDLRHELLDSGDEEPLVLVLQKPHGEEYYLELDGTSSSGGGRVTLLWFKQTGLKQAAVKKLKGKMTASAILDKYVANCAAYCKKEQSDETFMCIVEEKAGEGIPEQSDDFRRAVMAMIGSQVKMVWDDNGPCLVPPEKITLPIQLEKAANALAEG